MICANFCEILNRDLFQEAVFEQTTSKIEKMYNEKVKRIYVGSSFCSQYFLKINFWDLLIKYCNKMNYKITLCVPIFTEKDLSKGKEVIKRLIRTFDAIDEITVNDYGMLDYISKSFKININLGRLLFKDARDIRVSSYFKLALKPSLLSFGFDTEIIKGIELDPMSKELDLSDLSSTNGLDIALHTPFSFITTGNICKYGSVHKKIEKKFRPNLECLQECSCICEIYHERKNDNIFDVLRFGRTAYFFNPSINIIGANIERYLYFPIKEILSLTINSEVIT